MKRSIAHLPKEKQEDLRYIVQLILERIPQTQMIILYGSYATGKYVEFDTRIDFGIRTTYMSDYDILVVTDKAKDKEVGQRLDNIEEIYYKNPEKQTPVQFINDDIKSLNKYLSDGRYFYTQLKEEGIILYNTGILNLQDGESSSMVRYINRRRSITKKSIKVLMNFLTVLNIITLKVGIRKPVLISIRHAKIYFMLSV